MLFSIHILSVFQSNWLLYLCLGLVLVVQLVLLLRQGYLPKKRLWIRLSLNLFVWLLVFLFILQPEWKYTTNTNKILLTSANIPDTYIQKIKDSLQVSESFNHVEFNRLINKNPHFIEQLGNVYLLGQTFSPEILSRLSMKNLVWIPYFANNQLQDLQWKGLVKKGDIQEVSGKIAVDKSQMLKLNYGNRVLDSLFLQKGLNTFHFSFPAFSIGRTEALLTLNNEPLQGIRFYSHFSPTFNILFILSNPDFESKNLSEWLGKNNHRVELITNIAKDAQSKVSINKATTPQTFNADIVITDPANANHALVKKAVNEGKSILFINCISPEQELKSINQALGTNWHIKKISNEQSVNVHENLTALPYKFENTINQKSVDNYPVAIQKKTGKVGVSLLNETFPLRLSGDSLAYNKLWASIFYQLNPAAQNNVLIQSPVYPDTKTAITINNPTLATRILTTAGDTTQLVQSAINPLSFTANYMFRKTGWQPLQDSLSVYIEETPTELRQTRQIQQILQAYQTVVSGSNTSTTQALSATLPDWLWYTLLILALAALWLEPKLNF